MNPPMAELGLMSALLLLTALISSLVGFTAYRMGWMNYSPSLRWNLRAGYAIASGAASAGKLAWQSGTAGHVDIRLH